MKPLRSYHNRFEALALTIVYFSIVLGHLFLAPSFQPCSATRRNAVTGKNNQKNTELIYNLIRSDRCPWNGNKTLKSPAKTPLTFAHSFAINASGTIPAGNKLLYHFFLDHHFSYLSNRVIRI